MGTALTVILYLVFILTLLIIVLFGMARVVEMIRQEEGRYRYANGFIKSRKIIGNTIIKLLVTVALFQALITSISLLRFGFADPEFLGLSISLTADGSVFVQVLTVFVVFTVSMIIALLAGFLISFLIHLIADFVQIQIDTAENTGKISSMQNSKEKKKAEKKPEKKPEKKSNKKEKDKG